MRGRSVQVVAALGVCALGAWGLVGSSSAGAARQQSPARSGVGQLKTAGSSPAVRGKLSVAQQRALSRGYAVPDEAKYAEAKAGAARQAAAIASRGAAPSPQEPAFDGSPLRSWQGVDDGGSSPTDSTGTVGTSRYIELINAKIAFYDRTNNAPLSVGTLAQLTGGAGNLFDPQVIWDAGTNRFYYVTDDVVSSADNRLEIGFSKTATPSSTADFCQYTVSVGAEFYDYPKLGDSSNLWMVGANVYDSGSSYLRSDVIGITKPPAGATCPLPNTFGVTFKKNLLHADSEAAFTPLPANQTDPNATGWIVSGGFGSSNFLSVFPVTKNASNQMVVGAAKTVSVASYSTPAPAVQKGSTFKLDSSDTRLTNAVSAIDPSRSGGASVAIWTQHTVFGGPGAEVRWYEVNPAPATPVTFQTGTAGSSNLYTFNGAIAPDRRVNGASAMFGSSMVMGFNTSSSTQFINVMAVSKRGTHGQSPQEVIKAGTVPETDFSCSGGGICRSGDYGGASPDPASDTSKADGVVWQTNQFPGSIWHTWNFAGRPSAAPK